MIEHLPDQRAAIALPIAALDHILARYFLTAYEREALADAITALYEIGRRLDGTAREARS